MQKNNIFIFGIGEKNNKITDISNKLKSMGFNVIIGPSKSEHDYLYINCAFYRNSYDKNVGAFCADVGRIYILSFNIGMYIDASVEIGDNFVEYYNNALKHETYLVKIAGNFIDDPIMASSVGSNIFFAECLHETLNIPDRHIRTVFYAGDILTHIMLKKGGVKNSWSTEKVGNIYIDILPNIRNRSTVYKYGTGSGKNDPKQMYDYYKKLDALGGSNKPAWWADQHLKIIKKHGISSVNLLGLYDAYRNCNDTCEKEILKKILVNNMTMMSLLYLIKIKLVN